jgi:hypothetical protein
MGRGRNRGRGKRPVRMGRGKRCPVVEHPGSKAGSSLSKVGLADRVVLAQLRPAARMLRRRVPQAADGRGSLELEG